MGKSFNIKDYNQQELLNIARLKTIGELNDLSKGNDKTGKILSKDTQETSKYILKTIESVLNVQINHIKDNTIYSTIKKVLTILENSDEDITYINWLIITSLAHEAYAIHNRRKTIKYIKNSITDSLTGLGNRRYIEADIRKHIGIKKRYGTDSAILLIDTDHFKKVNDEYGHIVGDKVLVELSNILNKNTRETDTVGRWGGEEFIIILPGINLKDGEAFANNIKEKIQKELYKNVKEIEKEITISIGVTMLKNDDNTGAHAEDRADIALYEAKRTGRNKVCVNTKNPCDVSNEEKKCDF